MMANQWLRLWHDMPNDPKFRTVARQSGEPIGFVLAVYVHLLVAASNASERGRTNRVSHEDLASALDLKTEQVDAIVAAMQGRVLDGDKMMGWDRRQPLREDGGAERAKAWREAKKTGAKASSTEPLDDEETLANAGERKRAADKDTDEDKEYIEATLLVKTAAAALPDLLGDVPGKPKSKERLACPHAQLLDAFHGTCTTLPRVMKLNDLRRKHLQMRWREVDDDSKFTSQEDGIQVFTAIFEKVAKSDFLSGRKGDWHCTFDWLTMSSTNFLKVCEGHYDNDKRGPR